MFDLLRDTTPLDEERAFAMLADYEDAIVHAQRNEDVDGVIDRNLICRG